MTKGVLSTVLGGGMFFFSGGHVAAQAGVDEKIKSAPVTSAGVAPLHPDKFLELKNPTSRHDLPPEARAFLDTIAYAEGTDGPDGYKKMFTHKTFKQDVTKPGAVHPAQKHCSGKLCSTAAGRYQVMLFKAKETRFKGFTQWFQDTMAVKLIKQRGAWEDVLAGRFEVAIHKCRNEWASFPGNKYGQPMKSMEDLVEYAEKRREGYRQATKRYMEAIGKKVAASQFSAVAAKQAAEAMKVAPKIVHVQAPQYQPPKASDAKLVGGIMVVDKEVQVPAVRDRMYSVSNGKKTTFYLPNKSQGK